MPNIENSEKLSQFQLNLIFQGSLFTLVLVKLRMQCKEYQESIYIIRRLETAT